MDGEQLESQQTAQVNLVDLAGSERVAQAHTTGVRLRVSQGDGRLGALWGPCVGTGEDGTAVGAGAGCTVV